MKYFTQFRQYLAEVWGEVKPTDGKVSWPSREDVRGSTVVVIATVAILALYLGAIDIVFGWLIARLLGFGGPAF